jgi:steroid delta-isomerase-like uncharacterized protein
MPKARQVLAASVEAFNAHDPERFRSLYADNVVFEAPGDVRLEGADATVEYARSWLRAFPDAQITVETEVANGDWVAHRFIFEGTHEETLVGPSGEIPATNRRISVRGVEFARVEDGKIGEDYLCFDQAQVLTQLGLMPELVAST